MYLCSVLLTCNHDLTNKKAHKYLPSRRRKWREETNFRCFNLSMRLTRWRCKTSLHIHCSAKWAWRWWWTHNRCKKWWLNYVRKLFLSHKVTLLCKDNLFFKCQPNANIAANFAAFSEPSRPQEICFARRQLIADNSWLKICLKLDMAKMFNYWAKKIASKAK